MVSSRSHVTSSTTWCCHNTFTSFTVLPRKTCSRLSMIRTGLSSKVSSASTLSSPQSTTSRIRGVLLEYGDMEYRVLLIRYYRPRLITRRDTSEAISITWHHLLSACLHTQVLKPSSCRHLSSLRPLSSRRYELLCPSSLASQGISSVCSNNMPRRASTTYG